MPSIVHYGWAETTPALRGILSRGLGSVRRAGGRRRKRKANGAAKASGGTRRRKKRAASGRAHLVKGSAAAKRHMAKLRKMAKKARG